MHDNIKEPLLQNHFYPEKQQSPPVGIIYYTVDENKSIMIKGYETVCEQWPDFGCEGIKVQRAHQPTSQCQGKIFIFACRYWLLDRPLLQSRCCVTVKLSTCMIIQKSLYYKIIFTLKNNNPPLLVQYTIQLMKIKLQ
eukprot:TRINITY_DN6171_c0_g1_i4.p6 TRINITY_DN6171_c0_g1~~TRINITY_DN6171_c0_g1_i4.p6  ORF type:complete len:138 (+),score=12.12 TRINITY_DN6171_c0_g1_i4:1767-2180(+)